MAEDYKELLQLMQRMGKNVDDLVGNQNNLIARVKAVEESREGLKEVVNRLKALEDAHKGGRLASIGMPEEDRLKKENEFSFARAARAISTKDKSQAPREWTMMKEASRRREIYKAGGDPDIIKRDLTTDIDSGAGFIVPLEYVAELIELLRARVVIEAMGVTKMTGLTGGPVQIPKQTAAATAFWMAENAAITHAQQVVGMVEMRPREAAALTVLSNRLLRMSSPSAEAMVRNDLTLQLARLTDLAALRGSGGLQPLGIANTPGIGLLSPQILGTPTIDNLYNMIYLLEAANADLGSMGWVFHPRTWNTLRQIKDGMGRYILSPDPMTRNVTTVARPGVSGSLLGYPFKTTTQIPINLGAGTASEIYFGNFEDLIWGEWFGLELQASDVTSQAFEKNQTYIRAILEMDLVVRHGASFGYDNTVQP
jgi:HK97 family phage major capsid protein